MIGADDFESFFDPDEFGCEVTVIGAGASVQVLGMWGLPAVFGRLQRPGNDVGAAQLIVKPNQRVLQVSNTDVPGDWSSVKVVDDDAEFSVVAVHPHGRLRSLLILVPYGDRSAREKDPKQNGWLPIKPRVS